MLKKTRKIINFNSITRAILYLTVFLVPIFFLPLTSEVLDFNKTILFYILVALAAVFWFADFSTNNDKKIKKSPLSTPLIVFSIIFLVATVFSYQLKYSLLGQANYYHHSLLSIVFFLIFLFVLINTIKEKKEIKRWLYILVFASILSSVYYLIKIFGLNILPWDFSQQISFNFFSSSIQGYAVYISLMSLLGFVLTILNWVKWQRILLSFYVLLNLVILFLMDINTGWYALIIGFLILLFFFSVRQKEVKAKWISLSALIIALAILMIFFNANSLYNIGLSDDISLSQESSLKITKGSLSKNALFGSGPGTFYYNFFRFRPLSFNNTTYWDLNFIKAGSEWWQIISTLGILGFFSFLSLIIFFSFSLVKRIYKSKSQKEKNYLVFFISGTGMLFLSGLFFAYSFSHLFLLFTFFALGSSYISFNNKKNYSLVLEKYRNTFSSLGLSLIIILAIVVMYFSGRVWLANHYFKKANNALQKQEDLEKVQNYLIKATDNYSWHTGYNISLAQNYLIRAQLLSQEVNPDNNQLQHYITNSLAYANRALETDKKNPEIYSNLAYLYQDINLLTQDDISDQIADNFNQAINLDKNNPKRYYNLANYYSTSGQTLKNSLKQLSEESQQEAEKTVNNLFNLAIKNYEKAIELKNNYVLAQTAKALTYELKGDIETAINELTLLTKQYPLDYSLFYELGRIHLNQDNLEKAKSNFQKVTALFPGHSNAYWQLSLVYEKQGEIDQAISVMETVEKLNPENENVKQRLNELKSK